jgi:Ni,Fe-hydrogenase III large subunit
MDRLLKAMEERRPTGAAEGAPDALGPPMSRPEPIDRPLAAILADYPIVADHRPWPRHRVDSAGWRAVTAGLAAQRLDLLGLWADGFVVMAVVREPSSGGLAVVSLDCPDQRFPSLAAACPAARLLERALHDLSGLVAEGSPDDRPWLDHGAWPVSHPLGAAGPAATCPAPYGFLPVEGQDLHEVPVGPIHAGIIEPGHFRFTAQGEAVVRLEARLGYVHKGIERSISGADLGRAARLIGRVSGDATVAYSTAFARAVEAASGTEIPSRAAWLRALLGELERTANHLGDIGAICNDAAFALLHAHCGILREEVLATCAALFGHRLLMDRVAPGGVQVDLDPAGIAALRQLTASLRPRFERLVEIYDATPSLQDRTVGTGVIRPEHARQLAAGGFVGRASGRLFDARLAFPYPPFDKVVPEVPVRHHGDVDARVWVRMEEVRASLALMERLLDSLPEGQIATELAAAGGEGLGFAESFRGDVMVWIRLGLDGTVLRCHPRDPSWFHWPLLEVAIHDNIIADFPLVNKSVNASYSGCDL